MGIRRPVVSFVLGLLLFVVVIGFLDLIVHRADMPIIPGGGGPLSHLGFGLWRYPTAAALPDGRSRTSMPMRTVFTATIKIRNSNPYIPVDASRAAAIKEGWRRPLPVRLRINGRPSKAWRVNMMPVGDGSFYLYLHGTIREASGTAVG